MKKLLFTCTLVSMVFFCGSAIGADKCSAYFTIGSTEDEVVAIHGKPTSAVDINNHLIYEYGGSSVNFIHGKVTGYDDSGNNLCVKP